MSSCNFGPPADSRRPNGCGSVRNAPSSDREAAPGDAAGPRPPDAADGFQTPCGRLGSPPQADDVRGGAEENEKQDTSVYRSPSVHSRRRTTRGQRHRRTTASIPNGSRLIRDTNAPSAARIRQRGRIPKRDSNRGSSAVHALSNRLFRKAAGPGIRPSDAFGHRAPPAGPVPQYACPAAETRSPGDFEGRTAGNKTESRPKLSTDNRPKHTPAAETRSPGDFEGRAAGNKTEGRPKLSTDNRPKHAPPAETRKPGRPRRPHCRNQNGRSSGSSAGTDGAAGCP